MSKTIIALGSVTIANKAKKVLAREGIRSKLTKTDAQIASRGCTYAIEINQSDMYPAVRALRKYNIDYSIYEK